MSWPVESVRVPSLSTAGRSYRVRRDGSSCECTRFLTSPRDAKACSHTRLVLAAERLVARCQHTNADVLCFDCLVDFLAAAARKTRSEVRQAAKLAKAATRDQQRARRQKRKQTSRASRAAAGAAAG